jgi:hypothetical protein
VDGGQRGAESAPTGTLQRRDVVDPAIGAEVERHRGRDVLATEACDQDVEGGLIDTTEEARRDAEEVKVLRPVRPPELDLGTGQAYVLDRHAHRARRRVKRVAAPFEIRAHRLVALVHPCCEMRDTGRRVCRLHRIESVGALRGSEIALEEGVVVDGVLGLLRKNGDAGAWGALHHSPARATRVFLPGGEQGFDPTEVEVGVGEHGHR